MIVIMSEATDKLFEISDCQARRLGSGEYLFHMGDPVHSLFLILDGTVQLVRHQENGDAIVLQHAMPGDVIAEASLFSGAYHCDALAVAPTTVRAVSKQKALRKFRKDPKFAEAWAAHLASEVQLARLKSQILSLKTVALRLDAWFTWNPGALPPKGQWKQIASQIGVSPEALYRELAKRRKEKI